MFERCDILIIGAGPAGLALAAACAPHARTVLVAPEPRARWVPRYAMFADEADELLEHGDRERTWTRTLVQTRSVGHDVTAPPRTTPFAAPPARSADGGMSALPDPSELNVGYTLIDNDRMQERLFSTLLEHGGEIIDGRALAIEHHGEDYRVALTLTAFATPKDGLEKGEEPPPPPRSLIDAGLVIDATGHRSPFHPPPPDRPAQTAWGLTLRIPDHPWPLDAAVMMDWSQVPLPPDDPRPDVPSFLYVLPLSDDEVFLEETVLSATPQVPFAALDARLRARLYALGLQGESIAEPERCWIPMGGPPRAPRMALPFGSAAGLVHPATGYQVARSLGRIPKLVEALPIALSAPIGERLAIMDDALWPDDARGRQARWNFGLDALLTMSPELLRSFFSEFFALPHDHWRAYLSDQSTSDEVRSAMMRLFRAAPWSLRWHLMRLGMSGAGFRMVKNGGL